MCFQVALVIFLHEQFEILMSSSSLISNICWAAFRLSFFKMQQTGRCKAGVHESEKRGDSESQTIGYRYARQRSERRSNQRSCQEEKFQRVVHLNARRRNAHRRKWGARMAWTSTPVRGQLYEIRSRQGLEPKPISYIRMFGCNQRIEPWVVSLLMGLYGPGARRSWICLLRIWYCRSTPGQWATLKDFLFLVSNPSIFRLTFTWLNSNIYSTFHYLRTNLLGAN